MFFMFMVDAHQFIGHGLIPSDPCEWIKLCQNSGKAAEPGGYYAIGWPIDQWGWSMEAAGEVKAVRSGEG